MKEGDVKAPVYPAFDSHTQDTARGEGYDSPTNQPVAYGHPVASDGNGGERNGGYLQGSYPQQTEGYPPAPYNGYHPHQGYPPYVNQNSGYAPGHYATGQPVYAGGGIPMSALPNNSVDRRDEDEAVTILQWLLAGGLCCCAFPCCLAGCVYGFCCTGVKNSERVRKWACIHATMLLMGLVVFITVLTLCLVYADKWGFYYTHDDLASCSSDWKIRRVLYTPNDDDREGTLFIIGQGQASDIEDEYDFVEFGRKQNWATVVLSPPGLGSSNHEDDSRNFQYFGGAISLTREQEDTRSSYLTSALNCWKLGTSNHILVTLDGGAKYVTPGLLLGTHYIQRWLAINPNLDSGARVTTAQTSNVKTTIAGQVSTTDATWLMDHFSSYKVLEESSDREAYIKSVLLNLMQEV